MKKTISILLIIISAGFVCSAQIGGEKIPGPITVFDTLLVHIGDTLKLGRGSDPTTGNFVFIYQPMNALLGTPQQNLGKAYAGLSVNIKMFRMITSKKLGSKTFTIVNPGGLNCIVELETAINSGEIIGINGIDLERKKEAQVTVINKSEVSVADELRKLKELLKDSVITQEEFDQQKQKLLSK